ncbi:unnamed protein product, partial [Penicillium nalgiovense]
MLPLSISGFRSPHLTLIYFNLCLAPIYQIKPGIRELPNELLLWIVSHLDGSALFALAGSCKDVDFRLQPRTWKYNIRFQNNNLLHLAVKYDNVGLAEALLQHNANI